MVLDPGSVAPNEPVDHFVRDGEVRRKDNSIRRDAFDVPGPGKRGAGRLSVYRTEDCPLAELRAIYQQHVEPGWPGAVGSARFPAEAAYEQGLGFDPDGVPHTRHASIVNWPLDPDRKERLRDIQQSLADASAFVRF
jgi:hypothetical protein